MERTNRKRKAQEIAESPPFVSEKINELHSVWVESDTKLRKEISELRDEVGSLKKQLADKTEECAHFQDEAVFLHPDAVIDRIRVKLWHHGDLSILRNAMDPRTRVTRNVNRSLFLAETAPKKGSSKPMISDGRLKASELSPKHESEEAPPLLPPTTDPVTSAALEAEEKEQEKGNLSTPPGPESEEALPLLPPTTNPVTSAALEAEEKEQEERNLSTPPVPEIDAQATLSPHKVVTSDVVSDPLPENGTANPMQLSFH